MGTPKQVLPFEDTTMVGAVVEAARQSRVVDIVVVTGFHRREVEAGVGSTARLAHNPDAASGNMSSLLVGLDAVGDVDGVVILLSDMPQIETRAIDAVVEGVSKAGARAGWVEYVDGQAHPVALTTVSFPDVRDLEGTKALWRYLESLDDSEVFVARIESRRPTDVNTVEDYGSVTRQDPSR